MSQVIWPGVNVLPHHLALGIRHPLPLPGSRVVRGRELPVAPVIPLALPPRLTLSVRKDKAMPALPVLPLGQVLGHRPHEPNRPNVARLGAAMYEQRLALHIVPRQA